MNKQNLEEMQRKLDKKLAIKTKKKKSGMKISGAHVKRLAGIIGKKVNIKH